MSHAQDKRTAADVDPMLLFSRAEFAPLPEPRLDDDSTSTIVIIRETSQYIITYVTTQIPSSILGAPWKVSSYASIRRLQGKEAPSLSSCRTMSPELLCTGRSRGLRRAFQIVCAIALLLFLTSLLSSKVIDDFLM